MQSFHETRKQVNKAVLLIIEFSNTSTLFNLSSMNDKSNAGMRVLLEFVEINGSRRPRKAIDKKSFTLFEFKDLPF